MIGIEKAFAVDLVPNKEVTATGNETGVDMLAYGGYGMVVMEAIAVVGGTNPTLDVKIEQSSDNTNWDATAVTTFTQVTTSASKQSAIINLNATKRYLRGVRTIAGTPTRYTYGITIIANKKIL